MTTKTSPSTNDEDEDDVTKNMTNKNDDHKNDETSNKQMMKKYLDDNEYALHELKKQKSFLSVFPFFQQTLQLVAIPLATPVWLLLSAIMATPWKKTLCSMVLPAMMDPISKTFASQRKTLLRDLKKGGGSMTVLDFGSGGGAYLKYCTGADHVVAVEPIVELHDTIRKEGEKYDLKKLTILCDIDDDRIDESKEPKSDEIPKVSSFPLLFDFVILGNVLCEVPNVLDTLKKIDSRLKVGGKVYFSEHVAYPKMTWRRSLQDAMNPMWCHITNGCNCNRDSVNHIHNDMTNWKVVEWVYDSDGDKPLWIGPMILGLAIKVKEGGQETGGCLV